MGRGLIQVPAGIRVYGRAGEPRLEVSEWYCVEYFGPQGRQKWFDGAVWEAFATCCGVNLAGWVGWGGSAIFPRNRIGGGTNETGKL